MNKEMNRFEILPYGSIEYKGETARINTFVVEEQLYDEKLWKVFVQQFRERKDGKDGGWRGEFFGKMMRGACLTYQYTRDERLYAILEDAVKEFLTTQDDLGRFSTYTIETEFTGWDMWGRKYAMIALEYFYEISKSAELKEKILAALEKHADYIVENVGEGKKHPVAYAESFWHHAGLPSCSVLEPMVKLYKLTGKKAYLDYAAQIVAVGFTNNEDNLVEIFYRKEKKISDLRCKKAYEMMSCFQGLLEYYTVVKDKKYLTSVKNFVDEVIDTELTEIGALGTNYEFFNDSANNQTEPQPCPIAETCVTVTFINLCFRMLQFTGESRFADYIERSACNAMFGAVNTEKNKTVYKWNEGPKLLETKCFMPFDSYSPIVKQRRAIDTGGCLQLTDDGMKYGCCTCISSAGTAVAALYGIMREAGTYAINTYEQCKADLQTPSGEKFTLEITGEPFKNDQSVKIRFTMKRKEKLCLKLRIPLWSKQTEIECKGKTYMPAAGTYLTVCEEFENGDSVVIRTDTRIYAVRRNGKLLLKKCEYVLARDERYEDGFSDTAEVDVNADESVDARRTESGKVNALAEFSIPLKDGRRITVCDYSSAGKAWDTQKNLCVSVWF